MRVPTTPPDVLPVVSPVETDAQYRKWQRRVLIYSIIGYATFYFVRKNLSVAMPMLEKSLNLSKSDLGLFLTLHGVLYGISKFINGFWGDRCNARIFMVAGLLTSAILNVAFGFSSAVIALGIFWMLNGWFQGMGFPPCARLMTHWFPPKKLATKMSLWNTSHSLGAGLIVVLCGYLAVRNWRLCFLVPAGIAILCSLVLWLRLPDTPESAGLPEVEGTTATTPEEKSDDFKVILFEYVFRNPYIWLVAFANFFVYTIRYAVLDWGPTLLLQSKRIQLTNAGWMVAAFEISGLVGMLLAGWLTDRWFGGRGMRTCFIFMALAVFSILLFWQVAGQSVGLNTLFMCMAGFFIYGPQALVGIVAANLATKRAAASAVGLTGLFGYASTLLSGWGLGKLVELRGWNAGFEGMFIIAIIGALIFAAGWGAKPHGYKEKQF